MSEMTVGAPAPEFSLKNQDGKTICLADFKYGKVVLYFYPKDDTPGCTTEACTYRDEYSSFEKKGAVVLGISPDDEESHVKFVKKFALPFSLLSDTGHKVSEAYGVWVEKSMYGKKYMGVERSTFVIGPDGRFLAVYKKVKPGEHVADVLAAL